MDADAASKGLDEANPKYWFPTPRISRVRSSALRLDIVANYPIETQIRVAGEDLEASVDGGPYYEVVPPTPREGRLMVEPLFDVQGIAPYFFYYQNIPVRPPQIPNHLTLPALLNVASSGAQIGEFSLLLEDDLLEDSRSLILAQWEQLRVQLKAFVRDNSTSSIEAEKRAMQQNQSYNRFQAHFVIPDDFDSCRNKSRSITCALVVIGNGDLRLEQDYPW